MIFCTSKNLEINSGSNASLLSNNSFFNMVRKEKEIYLVHVTKNSDLIEKEGYLYPSGGCLMGSIYCTPGYKDGNKIRLHNLGRYYYECEMPAAIKEKKLSCTPKIYVIKIKSEKDKINAIGVDYLSFGKIHFDIYDKLNYLLTKEEKDVLENTIYQKINKVNPFLNKMSSVRKSNDLNIKEEFLNELIDLVQDIPIFGYVYFETITKTLMLHQSDEISKKHYAKGEFYNWHYKNMMLHFHKDFFTKFNLGTFSVPFDDIINYIEEKRMVDKIEDFKYDFFEQLFIFLEKVLLCDLNNKVFKQENIKLNLNEIGDCYKPLVGHIVHRELRNFKRYPDFYFYFDQMKALDIWNEWNKNDILIPYNSIIPKGEIGINPAYLDNLSYEVYEGINYDVIDDFAYVELGKKKDIKIAKRLVENKYSIMRNCKI